MNTDIMKNILKTVGKNFSVLFEFRKEGNPFEIGVLLCVINGSCDSLSGSCMSLLILLLTVL